MNSSRIEAFKNSPPGTIGAQFLRNGRKIYIVDRSLATNRKQIAVNSQ